MNFHLRIIIGLLFLIISTLGFAQTEDYFKVRLSLKSHDVLSGYVKQIGFPDFITIYTSKNDSIVVPAGMINRITIYSGKHMILGNGNNYSKPQTGLSFFSNSSFGILFGEKNNDESPLNSFTVETVNGIKILPFLGVGLGIGYDQYQTTRTIPLFLSIRGDLLRRNITPFYFCDIGGGAGKDINEENWNFETRGGSMYHFGLGIKVYSGSRINIMFAAGYKIQHVLYDYDNPWGGIQETSRTFRRGSFRLGIGF